MSEVILYIAVSLDGFIAPPNVSVDWLDEKRFQDGIGEDEDFGYKSFLKNVDLIVMGRKSYDQILDFGEWPYPEKHTKVFTHRIPQENSHDVEFVEEYRETSGTMERFLFLEYLAFGRGRIEYTFSKEKSY
ncbi:MAG: hypothetical protein VX560_05390 [SAR324 cluster bacterium]|nr:hypothetical protein [SAR324 cluster bacterium]